MSSERSLRGIFFSLGALNQESRFGVWFGDLRDESQEGFWVKRMPVANVVKGVKEAPKCLRNICNRRLRTHLDPVFCELLGFDSRGEEEVEKRSSARDVEIC